MNQLSMGYQSDVNKDADVISGTTYEMIFIKQRVAGSNRGGEGDLFRDIEYLLPFLHLKGSFSSMYFTRKNFISL